MVGEREFNALSQDEVHRMAGASTEYVIKLLEEFRIRAGSDAYYNLYAAVQDAIIMEWLRSRWGKKLRRIYDDRVVKK